MEFLVNIFRDHSCSYREGAQERLTRNSIFFIELQFLLYPEFSMELKLGGK